MKILLCSNNETIIKRWKNSLFPDNRLFEATSLESAYRILNKNTIDLTLMHRSLTTEKQIKDMVMTTSNLKVFVLSDRPNNEEGITCLQLGCIGYANAYIAQPRLNLAVQAVESGLIWTGTSLMQHMIQVSAVGKDADQDRNDHTESPILAELSKREYQVAALVADGLNNREVADRLDITERTVKAHLSSAYAKTSTKSRLGLARMFSKI